MRRSPLLVVLGLGLVLVATSCDRHTPFGQVDSVRYWSDGASGMRFRGWVATVDGADEVEIHVIVAGVTYNLGHPDVTRPDVEATGLRGAKGFDAWVPSPNSCDFRVYAVHGDQVTRLGSSSPDGEFAWGVPHPVPTEPSAGPTTTTAAPLTGFHLAC